VRKVSWRAAIHLRSAVRTTLSCRLVAVYRLAFGASPAKADGEGRTAVLLAQDTTSGYMANGNQRTTSRVA
jgi:hypothetical protein